jgi:PEP-CTERM motif
MKFSRILCTTALLGLALGMSAAVAHADTGTDPTVIVNRVPVDPVCDPATDATCLVAGGDISVNLNSTTTVDIGGTGDITSLSVTFPGMTNGQYSCFTDIFVSCFTIFNIDPTSLAGFTVTDLFTGGPGACTANGAAGGQCPGFLAPGDEITIQGIFPVGTGAVTSLVTTPEPSTILLMGFGLVGLFAFGRKRFASSFPA